MFYFLLTLSYSLSDYEESSRNLHEDWGKKLIFGSSSAREISGLEIEFSVAIRLSFSREMILELKSVVSYFLLYNLT